MIALDVQEVTTATDASARLGREYAPLLSGAQRRVQARVLLFCGDLVAIVAALVLASLALGRDPGERVAAVSTIILSLYVALSPSRGAFDRDAMMQPARGVRRALSSFTIVSLLAIGLGFAFKVSADYSRLEQAVAFALAIVFLSAARGLNARLIRAFSPRGLIDELLLHDASNGRSEPFTHAIEIGGSGLRPSLDCPDMLDQVSRACARFDRVILSVAPEARVGWVAMLKAMGTDVHVVMPEMEALGILEVGSAQDQPTAVVAYGPLRRPDALLKRAFDLAVVFALLPGIVVITLAAAIAIRLEDGGPVFFRQVRVGRANRQFAVLKFRSMRADICDPDGGVSTMRDDARVTRVGAILRKTSLDEVPQLLNVLLGDMSIVGPRPHALGSRAENALFWEIDQRYWHRHTVKPGITGLAQVRGLRGATQRAEDVTNRVQADLEYINNWSIWRDIRIAAVTLRVLLHPNAY